MPRSQAVANALSAKMRADQSEGSFYDDLGGRIYEGEAQQSDILPICVWTFTSVVPEQIFANADTLNVLMQADVWNSRIKGAQGCRNIHDKLVDLLDRADDVVADGYATVAVICPDQGSPRVEEDSDRQTSQWRLWALV